MITAGILLLEILRAPKRASRPRTTEAKQSDRGTYLMIAGVVVWTFLFFLVFEKLGFVIATTIYLFALMAYFNPRKWVTNALTSLLFCVGSYWMFKILGVNLAQGILPY